MKYADVRLAFKKDDETDKENYIPISILLCLSKVKPMKGFFMSKLYSFLDQMSSKLQFCFCKSFNGEQLLIHVIKNDRDILIPVVMVGLS